MTAEEDRTRLIGEIARVLRDGSVPDDARAGALTFIGWLARRMPGEAVSTAGVSEMVHRSADSAKRAVLGGKVSAPTSAARRPGKGPGGQRMR